LALIVQMHARVDRVLVCLPSYMASKQIHARAYMSVHEVRRVLR